MNTNNNTFLHSGTYEAPECIVLTLEAGTAVLNNGSGTLPTLGEEDEEDW